MERIGVVEFRCGAARLARPRVLVPTERHADVAEDVILELPHLAGNLLHDAHTAILMREYGIGRVCARDPDLNQFPFLEVIDPLRP
jgi:predicted nucleic acid-binding protein